MHAVDDLELHVRVVDMREEIEEVTAGEGDLRFAAGRLRRDAGFVFAERSLRRLDLHVARAEHEREVVVHLLREVVHAAHRCRELVRGDDGTHRRLLGDDLAVVGKLAFDEARQEARGPDLEFDLLRAERHLHVRHFVDLFIVARLLRFAAGDRGLHFFENLHRDDARNFVLHGRVQDVLREAIAVRADQDEFAALRAH